MAAETTNETKPEAAVEKCWRCDGAGYVMDFLGGCGDPECCGGPWPIKCVDCDNNGEAENAD